MGTVAIRGNFRKLFLLSPKQIGKLKCKDDFTWLRRSGSIDGCFFTISTKKNGSSESEVTFHLSKWKNYNDFLFTFSKLLPVDHIEVQNAKIVRMDCWIDLALPISFIDRYLNVPRVRVVERFHGKTKTIYYGQKPKEICAYEKEFKKENLDFGPEKLCISELVKGTRIEKRFFGNKRCPIKTFKEIPELKNFSPFPNVEWQALKPFQYLTFKKSDEMRLHAFEALYMRYGYEGGKKKFNELSHGHFSNQIKKHFVILNPNLNEIWQQKAQRYFK